MIKCDIKLLQGQGWLCFMLMGVILEEMRIWVLKGYYYFCRIVWFRILKVYVLELRFRIQNRQEMGLERMVGLLRLGREYKWRVLVVCWGVSCTQMWMFLVVCLSFVYYFYYRLLCWVILWVWERVYILCSCFVDDGFWGEVCTGFGGEFRIIQGGQLGFIGGCCFQVGWELLGGGLERCILRCRFQSGVLIVRCEGFWGYYRDIVGRGVGESVQVGSSWGWF